MLVYDFFYMPKEVKNKNAGGKIDKTNIARRF